MSVAIKKKLLRHISNIPGWRTKRKIVVFESDDWGSIRIPSKEVYSIFVNDGIPLNKNHFTKFDSLERNQDLEGLYSVLKRHKDKNGNNPIFSAMFIPSNPDFEKIKESGFSAYFYENSIDTLDAYPSHNNVYNLWNQGVNEKIFMPQFHGREHLHILSWIRNLNSDFPITKKAFDYNFTGVNPDMTNEKRIDYQAAFYLEIPEQLDVMKLVIVEGLVEFNKIFNFKADYFVPPNGPFNNSLESTLKLNGIKFIGTPKLFKNYLGFDKFENEFRYLGKRNSIDQVYITRNGSFEPSRVDRPIDWVSHCLSDIKSAFMMKKPAIISTHRVNYIGALSETNRDNGLKLLDELIGSILKLWPEVEFLSSSELGEAISKQNISNVSA